MKLKSLKPALTVLCAAALVSCATNKVQDNFALQAKIEDTEDFGREPAAGGPARVGFRAEYSNAKTVGYIAAMRDFKKRQDNKQVVLAKWAKLRPQDVRTELDRIVKTTGGVEVGRIELLSLDKTAPGVLVSNFDDARFVLEQENTFLTDTVRELGLPPSQQKKSKLAGVVQSKIAQIENELPLMAERLLDDQSYEGTNLSGKPFARIDVVDQLGRLLPHSVNATYLGLNQATYQGVRMWSRIFRDAYEFNVESDPRVLAKAKELLENPTILSLAAKNGMTPQEYLTTVSRVEITQSAIAYAIDVFLSSPPIMQAASRAASSGNNVALGDLIDEALRLKPVTSVEIRVAKTDVQLPSGKTIRAGQAAFVLVSVANRDPQTFPQPNTFDPKHARALGTGIFDNTNPLSRLSRAEVIAAVSALVRKPGLRRADGDWGQLDRRALHESVSLITNPLGDDEYRYTFPERFAVEWDITTPSQELQIPAPQYAYEAYLNDYDRAEYRLCISSQLPRNYTKSDIAKGIVRGLKVNKLNLLTMDSRDHFFCRLGKEFRACLVSQEKPQNFHHLAASLAHEKAFQACNGQHALTPTEQAFYNAVLLEKPLRAEMLDTKQAQRPKNPNYDFEDYLKFYDRYRARSSMMNPAGQAKYKAEKDHELMFYVRLNIDFRSCMGAPVIKHDVAAKVGIEAGASRPAQYEVCKNGVWNQASLRTEGKLAKEEKYYYERIFLGRDVTLEKVQ